MLLRDTMSHHRCNSAHLLPAIQCDLPVRFVLPTLMLCCSMFAQQLATDHEPVPVITIITYYFSSLETTHPDINSGNGFCIYNPEAIITLSDSNLHAGDGDMVWDAQLSYNFES